MNGIFDISSADKFFYSIERSFEKYQANRQRSIELLLYVIMGLNHLREWIAPNYNPRNDPTNDEERFYQSIFLNESFKTIQSLCNRTKHLSMEGINTSSSHGIPFDEWDNVDAVINFDKGPASNYFIGTTNIIEIIEEVIGFYKSRKR